MRQLHAYFCLTLLWVFLQCVQSNPWTILHPHGNTISLHEGQEVQHQFEQSVNLMRVIREHLQSHPQTITRIRAVLHKLSDGQVSGNPDRDTWVCPGQGETLCPAEGTGAPWEDYRNAGVSLVDKWNMLYRHIIEDPEGCQSCIETCDLLRDVVCDGTTWETIRDLLIPICELAFVEDSDPVMCNGSITLQGQHIYCIIQEANSRDICESLNSCYAPETRPRPPVSERTPWAVRSRQKAKETDSGLEEQETMHSVKQRKNSANLMKIAQLTDIHLQHKHVVGANSECSAYVCCLEDSNGAVPAREYGEYKCNLPPRTLDLFLDRVKEANPDFILYAGDSPPHTMWEETLSSQLNCSQLVVDAMTRSFGNNLRVYPNIGNHEMFPTNLFSLRLDETKMMTSEFMKMWSGLADFDVTSNQTMSDLAYYTNLVPGHPQLRIMSINTNYDWYSMNFYNVLNQYTPEVEQHKGWVRSTLETARNNSEKVIIIAHHPVGSQDANIRSARWWEEIATEYGDIILLHVSGHTHKNHFKMSFDHTTMEAKSINLIAASTTSKTNINPTMRMFYLDPDNQYSLVDFEDFYLDINTQDQSIGVPPVIAFSYSALEEYGMADLSPESFKDLVMRFTEDDALFDKFFDNFRSRSGVITCDYSCKVRQICDLWFSEISESDECVTLAPPAPTTTPTKIPPTEPIEPTVQAGSTLLAGPLVMFMVLSTQLFM